MNRYLVDSGTCKALVYANTEQQAIGLFRRHFRLKRDVALTCERIARNVHDVARVVPIAQDNIPGAARE